MEGHITSVRFSFAFFGVNEAIRGYSANWSFQAEVVDVLAAHYSLASGEVRILALSFVVGAAIGAAHGEYTKWSDPS
jgi:hypothetical protein